MSDDTLTAQQRLYVHEYLIDLNQTQAAIRAGYSEKTAYSIASELMQKPQIKEMIQKAMDARVQRTDITADLVLQEILRSARVDIGEIFDENGDLKTIALIPEDVRRAIQSIEIQALYDYEEDPVTGQNKKIQTGHTKKIKFNDKLKALELLAKHLKLLTDKVEIRGKLTLEDLISGSIGEDEKR